MWIPGLIFPGSDFWFQKALVPATWDVLNSKLCSDEQMSVILPSVTLTHSELQEILGHFPETEPNFQYTIPSESLSWTGPRSWDPSVPLSVDQIIPLIPSCKDRDEPEASDWTHSLDHPRRRPCRLTRLGRGERSKFNVQEHETLAIELVEAE